MDTKKLRQKILDLAIHGKLVPQDPNDEPASVLLQRIRTEKERLIKEGKIKRSRKSAKTSDTPHYVQMPFELPQGWVWITLEEISSKIGSGSTPKGGNYSKDGIPFFRSQNVYNEGLVCADMKFISNATHKRMIGTEVRPKDLLLNITGGSLGRCAIVSDEFQIGNVSQHVCIIRPIFVLSSYVHSFILSSLFKKSMNITGSGREGLPKYNLEKMFLPLPPLTEQTRIVTEIEHWTKLIDAIEQGKIDLQIAIKQAKSKILELAIHGKLVPQNPADEPASELLKRINPKAHFTCDNEHYPQLPKGWYTCRLEEVFDMLMGQSPEGGSINSSEGIEFHQGKIFFTEKFLSKSHYYTSEPIRVSPANSLLLCVRAPVGAVNLSLSDVCIGRGLCSLHPKECLELRYAFYCLTTYRNLFEQQSTGSTFKSISKDIIRNQDFALPPLTEQKRIVEKIEQLFRILEQIEESL